MTGANKAKRTLVVRTKVAGFLAPGTDTAEIPYERWILAQLLDAAAGLNHDDHVVREQALASFEQAARIITAAQERAGNREMDARAPRTKKAARENVIARMVKFIARQPGAKLAQYVADEVRRGEFEDMGGEPRRFLLDRDADYRVTESSLADLWTAARRR